MRKSEPDRFGWFIFWGMILAATCVGFWTAKAHAQSTSVTVSNYNATSGEFDLAISIAGPVTLTLNAQQLDWCKPGGELATVATPTTPDLGVPNNDGVSSQFVTITGPVTTHCDIDPNVAAFPGGSVTAAGVTLPLVQANGVWTATFGTVPAPPPPPTFTGTATLNWTAPTTNTDGSPLLDLIGFKVYWSTTLGTYPNSVRTNSSPYVVQNLADGTWYFVVTALSSAGGESAYSAAASKVVSSGGPPPPPPPPPNDPCVVSPLAVPTNLSWPTSRTGRRSLGWSSPANIVAIAYAWPIGGQQRATWTDDRGCTVTVLH